MMSEKHISKHTNCMILFNGEDVTSGCIQEDFHKNSMAKNEDLLLMSFKLIFYYSSFFHIFGLCWVGIYLCSKVP